MSSSVMLTAFNSIKSSMTSLSSVNSTTTTLTNNKISNTIDKVVATIKAQEGSLVLRMNMVPATRDKTHQIVVINSSIQKKIRMVSRKTDHLIVTAMPILGRGIRQRK